MKAKNLQTGEYEPQQKVDLDAVKNGKSGIKGLVTTEDKYGEYAWAVMSKVLVYAASLVPEIAGDVYAVDGAMKMGFGWKFGPFELIDQLGPKWFAAKLREEGREVPELLAKVDDGKFFEVRDKKPHFFDVSGSYKPCPRGEGVVLLSDIKLAKDKVDGNDAASLWNIGDGVLCIEFHTKMNAMETDVFTMYHKALELIGDGKGDYKALVIHNEGRAFSAGANLAMFIGLLNTGQKDKVEEMIAAGQDTYKKLKFAPFPVVAAPTGMALGGGCEILLHVDAVTAHAETYMGLVEIGVGLLPAWGGCKEMLLRYKKATKAADGSMEPVKAAFGTISTAKTSTSAADAFDIGYLRDGQDSVVMNVERLLSEAKKKALELANGYQPPAKETIALPGESAKIAMEMAVNDAKEAGKATEYDAVVCGHIATVLSGGDASKPLSENDILTLEREEFMKLCDKQGTLDRIEHMLETGKPLRN